jgi:hypothetical protein
MEGRPADEATMRWLPPCLVLVSALGAQAPLHIVSVERRGLPPYEAADRTYGLDGGHARGLKVGDRLIVTRTGEALPLGHLRVTEVRGERSGAAFEPAGAAYPMKGDLAILEELLRIPEVPRLSVEPIPLVPAPRPSAVAPPREGLLFFLPQQAELSPAGLKKLEAWIAEWGPRGRWVVHVPSAKALKPVLQKLRAEALQAALHSLGIEHATVETQPRTADGQYDPAWIRHWD